MASAVVVVAAAAAALLLLAAPRATRAPRANTMPAVNSTSLAPKAPYGTGSRAPGSSSSTSTTLGATVKSALAKDENVDAALTKLDTLSGDLRSAATQAEAALRGRASTLEAAFKAVRKREEEVIARHRQLDEREKALKSRERAVAAREAAPAPAAAPDVDVQKLAKAAAAALLMHGV